MKQPFLELVVGFDGTPSSSSALETACTIARARGSRLTIVYLSHPSAGDLLGPPDEVAAVRQNEEEVAEELRTVATDIVGDGPVDTPIEWVFEHRHGNVGETLLEVASGLQGATSTPERRALILVGSPDKRHDQLLGSVPRSLTHQNRIALAVIPAN